jgi:hypothetical protein
MRQKWFRRKQTWSDLRDYSGIFLEGPRKTLKNLSQGSRCVVEIRTRHLSNTNQKLHNLMYLLFTKRCYCLATGWSPVQGVLPTLCKIRKLKERRGPNKGLQIHWWISETELLAFLIIYRYQLMNNTFKIIRN